MSNMIQLNTEDRKEVPVALYKAVDMKLHVLFGCKPNIGRKLFEFCKRYPDDQAICAHDAGYLIEMGLINRNGTCYSILDDVRCIILTSVRINEPDIILVDPRSVTKAEMPNKK